MTGKYDVLASGHTLGINKSRSAQHLCERSYRGICASVWNSGCQNHQICAECVVDAHGTDVTPEMKSCPHTIRVPYFWLLVTAAQVPVTEGDAHCLSVPKYTVYFLDLYHLSQPVLSLVYTGRSPFLQIFVHDIISI